MGDVARRARISPATLYRKFAGKTGLVEAVWLREARRFLADMDDTLEDVRRAGGDAEDQVVTLALAVVDAIRRNRLLARLMQTEPELILPLMTTQAGPVLALGRDYVTGVLTRLQDEDLLPAFDPEPVAEVLARLSLSLALTPESVLPLDDEQKSRELFRAHIVPALGLPGAARHRDQEVSSMSSEPSHPHHDLVADPTTGDEAAAEIRAEQQAVRAEELAVLRRKVDGVAVFLAGPSNVVLQLAWPEVGYGVVESKVDSGKVTKHPFKRFRTTIGYLGIALLGSHEQRAAFRKAIDGQHRQVRSTPESPVKYNAFNRDLQLWVASCIYYGTIDIFTRMHGPLSRARGGGRPARRRADGHDAAGPPRRLAPDSRGLLGLLGGGTRAVRDRRPGRPLPHEPDADGDHAGAAGPRGRPGQPLVQHRLPPGVHPRPARSGVE